MHFCIFSLNLFSMALYKVDLLPVVISIQYSLPHSKEIRSYCACFANDKDAIAQVLFLNKLLSMRTVGNEGGGEAGNSVHFVLWVLSGAISNSVLWSCCLRTLLFSPPRFLNLAFRGWSPSACIERLFEKLIKYLPSTFPIRSPGHGPNGQVCRVEKACLRTWSWLPPWPNSSLAYHLIALTFSFLHPGIRLMLPFQLLWGMWKRQCQVGGDCYWKGLVFSPHLPHMQLPQVPRSAQWSTFMSQFLLFKTSHIVDFSGQERQPAASSSPPLPSDCTSQNLQLVCC